MASLLYRDALKKLGCCLLLAAPLCCATLAGLLGAALAYFQGWPLQKGVWVALEELLLTGQDLSGGAASELELGSVAAKTGLAVCSLWGVAFLGMLVGVVGGPLMNPILAQLGLLPTDGRARAPGSALLPPQSLRTNHEAHFLFRS